MTRTCPAIAQPMLFVQGSRDPFGTADEIRALLPALQHATLHEIPNGDHSFKVSGRGAPKPDAVLNEILDVVKLDFESAPSFQLDSRLPSQDSNGDPAGTDVRSWRLGAPWELELDWDLTPTILPLL